MHSPGEGNKSCAHMARMAAGVVICREATLLQTTEVRRVMLCPRVRQ
jgi:hypothetical protein